ncbi:hypothetical protein [Streptomyces sp. NPDC001978]|uniref:hypothetical protein n=1 Tax=Streptomyces sp. NPDC001978 TaxID=3364627 RepID=UPI00369CEF8D
MRGRLPLGGVLLPPGPQFQVVRQELPQDVAAPQVKEFFQLTVVQAGTGWRRRQSDQPSR